MRLSGGVSGVDGLTGYGKQRHGEQNPVPLFLRCQLDSDSLAHHPTHTSKHLFFEADPGWSQTGVPESQLRVANSLKEWTGLQLQYPQHTRKLAGPNGLPGFQLRGSVDG